MLEAVVSRMKTVHEKDLSRIRFVAVSATIPNLVDIATWLGSGYVAPLLVCLWQKSGWLDSWLMLALMQVLINTSHRAEIEEELQLLVCLWQKSGWLDSWLMLALMVRINTSHRAEIEEELQQRRCRLQTSLLRLLHFCFGTISIATVDQSLTPCALSLAQSWPTLGTHDPLNSLSLAQNTAPSHSKSRSSPSAAGQTTRGCSSRLATSSCGRQSSTPTHFSSPRSFSAARVLARRLLQRRCMPTCPCRASCPSPAQSHFEQSPTFEHSTLTISSSKHRSLARSCRSSCAQPSLPSLSDSSANEPTLTLSGSTHDSHRI
jgi:hypothetical protein